jgi:hypothetical protein
VQALYCDPVVVREACRDAGHPRVSPVDRLSGLGAQLLLDQRLELVMCRVQPR